jgi:hypothetical protein
MVRDRMRCPHHGCTGVHDNNRFSELCPRSRARKQEKDTDWLQANPDKRFRKQERDRERYRRQAGWYEPGGMATDEDMERLRAFSRQIVGYGPLPDASGDATACI